MHLRLNGRDIDTIQLKPALELSTRKSEIVRLPTGSLLPFTNTLTVDFYFQGNTPPSAQSIVCDSSGLVTRSAWPSASVLLPRLELFADAGYPFTEWPDLGRTAVIMPAAPQPDGLRNAAGYGGILWCADRSARRTVTVADADHLDQVQDKDLF